MVTSGLVVAPQDPSRWRSGRERLEKYILEVTTFVIDWAGSAFAAILEKLRRKRPRTLLDGEDDLMDADDGGRAASRRRSPAPSAWARYMRGARGLPVRPENPAIRQGSH
jgi:hypothetical protein